MDKKIILTENPRKELWNQFKPFENEEVCLDYFKKCNKFEENKFKKRASLMKYYIIQAKEYYNSARESSVLTKPTLLYYGASCLVKLLLLAKRCYEDESRGHGLTIPPQKSSNLLDLKIRPTKGTFLQLYQLLENKNSDLIKSLEFNLEDLFSFIPELKDDFEEIFNKKSLTLNFNRIKDEDGEYLYCKDGDLANNFFNNVPNFFEYYLTPCISQNEGICCFKRPNKKGDITIKSVRGEEFLISSLNINNNYIYLSQISAHFSILYLLSMLSRYYVNFWVSENSLDKKRYFYIIEKFLDITERKFPNLILNEILNKEIIFSVEYYKPQGFNFDEIKGMVKEIVNDSIEKNNAREEKEEIKRKFMNDVYSGKNW